MRQTCLYLYHCLDVCLYPCLDVCLYPCLSARKRWNVRRRRARVPSLSHSPPVCVHLYHYAYACMCACTNVPLPVCAPVPLPVCVPVPLSVCAPVPVYHCLYVCLYPCLYVCLYPCLSPPRRWSVGWSPTRAPSSSEQCRTFGLSLPSWSLPPSWSTFSTPPPQGRPPRGYSRSCPSRTRARVGGGRHRSVNDFNVWLISVNG